jgi:hypothetical protein
MTQHEFQLEFSYHEWLKIAKESGCEVHVKEAYNSTSECRLYTMYLLIPSKIFDNSSYYAKSSDREELIMTNKAVIITESYTVNDVKNDVPLTSDFYPNLCIEHRHDRDNYADMHTVYYMNDIESARQEKPKSYGNAVTVFERMSEKDIEYFKDKWEMQRLLRGTQQDRYYAHQDLKEALIKLLSEIIQKVKRVEIENRKAEIMATGEDYAV